MKLSEYQESINLQKSGAPISVGDAVFYVRRLGTPECAAFAKKLRAELFGPFHKYKAEDDSLLTAHLLTEYLVTGWSGVKNEDDTELAYTEQAARSVFLNQEYWLSLNLTLLNAAGIFENYLYEQLGEDVEALKKP